MLSTLDHNSRLRHSRLGWFEEFAVNLRVPVSAAPAFHTRLRDRGNRFLVRADDFLHFLERRRKKGERTVRIGVGIYVFRDRPPFRERGVRRKKGAKK
jgi:hypothetical protein